MSYETSGVRKLFYFIFLAYFSVLFFLPSNISAVSISPARQTVVIEPGKSQTAALEVFNDERKELIIVPEVDAFGIDSKTGQAVFGKEDEAVGWITAEPKQIRISPGEKGKFSFLINVPEGVEPRGHYLGLFAKQIFSEGQVGVGLRGGSLLFLHIAGVAREELVKQKFETDKKIYFKTPAILQVEFKNTGTIHIVPSGEVVLVGKNQEVINKFVLNPQNRKVLPDEVWQAEYVIGEEILQNRFGKIEMRAKIDFGQTRRQIVVENEFWLAPWWMAGLAASSLVVFIIIFFLIKIFYRQRKVL